MLPNLRSVGARPDFCFYKPDTRLHTRFPARYTEDDWLYNSKVKMRTSLENQRLSERVVENSKLIVQEADEIAKDKKNEVDHQLEERMKEIRFLIDELKKQKKLVLMEVEALVTFRDRILNAIEFLKIKSLEICQQCLILREGRIGVDLCDDTFDHQLKQEMKVITGCQTLLDRLLRETKEQLRELRAAMYLLDKDLEYKDKAFDIDDKNFKLKLCAVDETRADHLDPVLCKYPLSVWEYQTYNNIEANAKQIVSTGQLRAYIDLILKQVVDDLVNQKMRTDEALERHLEEMKDIKSKLEIRHRDVMEHASYVKENIRSLESQLEAKTRSLALCQTRLENRGLRPSIEATCDKVQQALYDERRSLVQTICSFKEKIEQNKTMLRYLLSVQMSLAEEINIKANSIKIDEVDCSLLRQQIHYQTF